MSKNYIEILKSGEWINKRLKIFRRDNFKCQKCGSTKNIQAHHKKYIKGKMPWEVPDNYLITLCSNCHNKEHENKNISEFLECKNKKNKKATSKKEKETNSISKIYKELSKSDLIIQNMYDKRKIK